MISVEARLISKGPGLLAWTEEIEDPRVPLEHVRQVVMDHIEERFATRSSPWGAEWAPITITTLEIRIQRGQGPPRVRFGARARVADGGQAIAIGFGSNNVPEYLHRGGAHMVFGRPGRPMPARPILPLTAAGVALPDALREEVMDAFRDGVREGLRRR